MKVRSLYILGIVGMMAVVAAVLMAGGAQADDGTRGCLLIPESTDNTVGMYDPYGGTYLGDLINDSQGILETPLNAVLGPDGDIYLSDQVADAVYVYDVYGTYLYTYANASDGLNNIRGIDFYSGNLYITSGDDYVAAFSGAHARLPDFINDGSDPFDILFLGDGRALLSDIAGSADNVRLYYANGTLQQELFNVSFPEQLQVDSRMPGDYLVGSYSDDVAIDFALDGTIYQNTSLAGCRGVYRLGNGNLLLTNANGVHEVESGTGTIIETKKTASARFIEYVELPYGFVYIDENDNGAFDWGEWNGTSITAAVENASNGDTIIAHDGTYQENVVIDKEISLINGSQPVVDALGGTGFNVTAHNVTISGFNITNASYGINCSALGFIFSNNTINATVDGINLAITGIASGLTGSQSFTVGNSTIHNNTIDADDNALHMEAENWGYNMHDSSICTIGSLVITDNIVTSGSYGFHIYTLRNLSYDMHDSAQFTFGGLHIERNDINASSDGIYLRDITRWGYNMSGGVATFGDIRVTGNVINATGDAMECNNLYEWAYNLDGAAFSSGMFNVSDNEINVTGNGVYFNNPRHWGENVNDSTVEFAGFRIAGNNISSERNGIYLNNLQYWGYEMYNDSSFGMGDFEIAYNNITVNGSSTHDGIYGNNFEKWGYNMHDSSFKMGELTVASNTVNVTGDDGIYLNNLQYWGYNMNPSSFAVGNVTVVDNIITAYANNETNRDGIRISNPDEWGYNMTDSSFAMGDFLVNRNWIYASGDGIEVPDMDYHGCWMNGSSSFLMGDVQFCNNNITTTNHSSIGMDFDDFDYWGYYMNDTSSFEMGDALFNDNDITAGDDGIEHEEFERHGDHMYNDTSFMMGTVEFCRNNITAGGMGMDFDDFDYWGSYLYGAATATMGNVLFNDNVINAGDDGIEHSELEYHGYKMSGDSSFVMGNVEFCRNYIISGAIGMDFDDFEYWGKDMQDAASFQMEDILVNNNTIYAASDGTEFACCCGYWANNISHTSSVSLGDFTYNDNMIDAGDIGIEHNDIWAVGRYVYNASSLIMGDVEFCRNNITASDDGIELDDFRYWGQYVYGTASLIFGDICVNDNVIDAGVHGIIAEDFQYHGYEMYNDTSLARGSIEFCRNHVNTSSTGIELDDFEYWGSDIWHTVAVSVGDLHVCDNDVNATGDGIRLDDITRHGHMMYNDSTFTGGILLISGNHVANCTGTPSGVHLQEVHNATISENQVVNCSYGIYLGADTNHTAIIDNILRDNDVGVYVWGGTMAPYDNANTSIHYNQISGNAQYGVIYHMEQATTPYINATWNWWGSGSGPGSVNDNMVDPVTGHPANGTGDEINGTDVYDNIHFDPWIGPLQLYQGWNMISPGFLPDVTSAQDLADHIGPECTVVTRWDHDKQRYISHIAGTGTGFSLPNGSGYFVYVTADVEIQFTDGFAVPDVNLTLSDGFNLVGWPYIVPTNASSLADDIPNCVKVSMFNAANQSWLPEYITALPGISYNFDVLMGEGVFVFVGEGPVTWNVD